MTPLLSLLSPMSSVPGLRPLLDVNYLPLTDMRIARTFCFTNLGQAMYLTSPTEIQRITYNQDVCENLQVCKHHMSHDAPGEIAGRYVKSRVFFF